MKAEDRKLGCLPPLDTHRLTAAALHLAGGFGVTPESKGFAVEDEVDLSALRMACGPILDQGQVGDCVWNTIWEAFNAVLVKYGYPPEDISRLWGYARTRQLEGTPLTEDSGCVITDAMLILVSKGACPAALWPDITPEARYTLDPPPETDAAAAQHKANHVYALSDDRWLMASHTLGFPGVLGIDVYESFYSTGPDGRVPMPGPGEKRLGGHAMPTFGHSKSFVNLDGSCGAKHLPNSWGEGFGDRGWLWLPDGYPTFDVWTVHQVRP